MDELVDVLDVNRNRTGKKVSKSDAHKNGWFQLTVHIWFYTKNKYVLLQQRAKNKDTHPLLWDVSVAGQIGANEDILDSAIRETKEEIGLTIFKTDLKKIGCFKSVEIHTTNLIDCEYHHTYICELKIALEYLQKQNSEVEALQLMSLKQFKKELQDIELSKKYVPHSKKYYNLVLNTIEKHNILRLLSQLSESRIKKVA